MESSAYTERTLAMAIQAGSECGCVRVCVQAYLHRSAGDIERLNAAAVPVRLVKGAYREPPSAAFPRKQDVDANYIALMKNLLDHGVYPAIATHDEKHHPGRRSSTSRGAAFARTASNSRCSTASAATCSAS